MNAVDTNVLVYYVDADEAAKRPKAIALLQRLGKAQTETLCYGRWPPSF